MLVVGLTGGIASGKTTVSDLFAEYGAAVIDADIIGRQMLDPGQPGYHLVVERLGKSILQQDQTIDRKLLRQAVFNHPELKQWLEESLHPLIYKACETALSLPSPVGYAILVVPLMFETDFHQLADQFCVIDSPVSKQIERLTARDNIDRELAQKMIASQMDREARLERANDVINNSGAMADLQQQVKALHDKYLQMAADKIRQATGYPPKTTDTPR